MPSYNKKADRLSEQSCVHPQKKKRNFLFGPSDKSESKNSDIRISLVHAPLTTKNISSLKKADKSRNTQGKESSMTDTLKTS